MLISFEAQGVFKYLNYHIRFHDDLNFLVGGNGSGKTTALRLLNALLVPNFEELMFIPFSSVRIALVHEKELIHIDAKSNGREITLRVTGVDEVLSLPVYSRSDLHFIMSKNEYRDDLKGKIYFKYSDHLVVKKIANIPSPIFLGLDRRREIESSDLTYYQERDAGLASKRASTTRRLIRGSLGVSLMETEMLVQEAYKRIRTLEEMQSERLRDAILLSAFEYSEFDQSAWETGRYLDHRTNLLQRKKEIKDALSNIGVKDKLSNAVDVFFDRITQLLNYGDPEFIQGNRSIELLTNKTQIDRIAKIVEIIDGHKSKTDAFFKPINEFISTINDFYFDSKKRLIVDTVGRLVVKREDGEESSIEGLSSGERQLLVIFAHAFFNKYKETKHKNVFIIDEPELSLHLKWQEKFAVRIFEVAPKAQFIMATHSPEIIGNQKNKAMLCR